MKFEALIFDLDGTAIPKRPEGMPSQAVMDAVKEAKKVCHVSCATGRPLQLCEDILEALDLDDLCILNGGTHLYSRKTGEFIWKQEIEAKVLQELFAKLEAFSHYYVADEKRLDRVLLPEYQKQEDVGLVCIFSTTAEDAQQIVSIVNSFGSTIAHPVSSWKDGTFDVHISHELATKKHAMQALLAHLNVDIDKVMVAGDGGNDIPLFELAGWRVAMGNASPELKEHADWIAPTVDDDGLAVAIMKFIIAE